ncbi:heterokaryon incompatibility protein-domain-containing protein [Ilyonectria robusta]|uniref:heterokaryon incompatibility protein-domain-containing protein n=1 Tax=Ilyonectria robusta TaxID=1079257 RepID=UPI001E8EB7D4|nr:heterokaryon incompatibility protein-domain-containing protein [Ilyonectria robusta]KAH8657377.1 heterokaryon incompatibility protein-domain-containing protein [Ilyonectria robusta]
MEDKLSSFVSKGLSAVLLPPLAHGFSNEGAIGHPTFKFIGIPPLNLYPWSSNNLSWMKRRLNHCRKDHPDCNEHLRKQRRRFVIPKRLIDAGPVDAPIVRLVTSDSATTWKYAIASYAWGTGLQGDAIRQTQTTQANVESRMEDGIQLANLPKTIRDLIQVTRHVGYRFIWIDALCIVQDDDYERNHQLDRMVEFYKQADVLVSAASASHCDEGFLKLRDADKCYGSIYELPFELSLGDQNKKGSVFLCEKSLDSASDEEPVHMRIWTWQEHLVSTRVLSFGSRQVRWKCLRSNAVDGGDPSFEIGSPEHMSDQAFSGSPDSFESNEQINWRFQAWLKIVEEYSFRKYTRASDRLLAFSESISRLAPLVGWPKSECYAGIWKTDAARQILWRKKSPLDLEQIDTEQISGPSWSWATLPDGVWYETGVELRTLNDSFKMIEVVEDSEGHLRLDITGYIREAYWHGSIAEQVMMNPPIPSLKNGIYVKIAWDVYLRPQQVWLLDVAPYYRPRMSLGLVLVKVSQDPERFVRRGLFEAGDLHHVPNNAWEVPIVLSSDQEGEHRNISIV